MLLKRNISGLDVIRVRNRIERICVIGDFAVLVPEPAFERTVPPNLARDQIQLEQPIGGAAHGSRQALLRITQLELSGFSCGDVFDHPHHACSAPLGVALHSHPGSHMFERTVCRHYAILEVVRRAVLDQIDH